MDIESLHYFKELTKDMNMTQTAKKLYLSQQTLSNHIARLEKQCGTPLFYRKPHLALTAAGMALLEFADKVLSSEQDFKGSLADILDESSGVIRFGASFIRYYVTLPAILPTFSKRYPHVSIQLTDDTTNHLLADLQEDKLDVVLTVEKEDLPGYSSLPLLSNQVYLLAADRLLRTYYGNDLARIKTKARRGAHLADFLKLPFYIITPPNHLGTIISNCFKEAGAPPRIYLQSAQMRMSTQIASKALAATFTTSMPLITEREQLAEDVNVFPLLYKNSIVDHNLYLSYNENHYIPKYIHYFIGLIKDYFYNVNAMDLTRIV